MAPSEVGNEAPRASRHTRRKAATRAKITQAANQLFSVKGYQETSVEDISELADVAVRTIYMHFPSKAAILLDHFDEWPEVPRPRRLHPLALIGYKPDSGCRLSGGCAPSAQPWQPNPRRSNRTIGPLLSCEGD